MDKRKSDFISTVRTRILKMTVWDLAVVRLAFSKVNCPPPLSEANYLQSVRPAKAVIPWLFVGVIVSQLKSLIDDKSS